METHLAVTLDKTDTTLNQGFHQDSYRKKKRSKVVGGDARRYLYCFANQPPRTACAGNVALEWLWRGFRFLEFLLLFPTLARATVELLELNEFASAKSN